VFDRQRIDFVYLGQTMSFRVEQSRDVHQLARSLRSLTIDESPVDFIRIRPSITTINVEFDLVPTSHVRLSRSTTLADIGGLTKEKADLADLVIRSSTNDDMPIRGILLYGPKGCGKTMLINALANEIDANIIRINPSDIYSRHYGESESKLKRLFGQTRVDQRKSLLVVENIESLCPNQERVTQQLERRLTTTFIELLDRHLDGIDVLLVATTNRIDSVDTDLRRPGRIDEEIEIGIPNQHDRFDVRHDNLVATVGLDVH
jgi:SpoVK/Ycf46/Vps4 family AAA+-type ATPase